MQKNPLGHHLSAKKFLLIKKLCCCLLTINLLFGVTNAQTDDNSEIYRKTIAIGFNKDPLNTALLSIEKQSGFRLVFPSELVKKVPPVTLSKAERTVAQTLDLILQGTDLDFRPTGNTIVVFQKEKTGTHPSTGERITVRGIVKDENGLPLAGAYVFLKSNRQTGEVTDRDGNFSFLVPLTALHTTTLLISYVGFEQIELPLDGRSSYVVNMKVDQSLLEEAVVTGYQTIEKRQSTSSIAMIKTEDLHQIGATSIEQMLQGQLAGLSIVNTSTGAGAAPKVRVRGTTTILGNGDPLWVLDGVPLESSVPVSATELNDPDFMEMFNSVIGGVSPNDIESITILKDASATAIYGTRAANGVIVVTTKKGMRDGLNISYQHASSIRLRPSYNDFNMLNSKERIELTRQLSEDGMSVYTMGSRGLEGLLNRYVRGNISLEELQTQTAIMESRNTDWFGILYRNAYAQTHNLSVSGGSDKINSYTSVSYVNEQGLDKISDYRNFSGLSKVNMEPFRGVNLTASLQAGRRDRNSHFNSSTEPFRFAMRTTRTMPLYDDDGDYFFDGSESSKFNILNEQNNTHRSSTQTDLKGMLNLSVNLYKGIKYTGMVSYASAHSSDVSYATERSTHVAGLRGYAYGEGTEEEVAETPIPFGGVYSETTYEQRTSLIRNGFEYKGMVAKEFSIELLGGQEFRTTTYKGLTGNGYGYMHDRGNLFYAPSSSAATAHITRNTLTRTIPERSYVSYYGVLSAMYKERYIINGNVRFDGSNLFGSNPKYRYLPLWSISGKWIVSGEGFMASLDGVNELALRASFGLRGNIVEDSSPQLIAQVLNVNRFTQLLEMEIVQPPNPNLKWETTSSLNIGLDFGLFNHRLRGAIDYYLDNSSDLIAFKDITWVTGFTNRYVNYADVRNQGIDVALSAVIIKRRNLSWTASLNFGYVKNEVVTSFTTPSAQNLVKSTYVPGQVYEGKPVNAMFSYRFAHLDEKGDPLFYDAENNAIGREHPEITSLIYSNVENLVCEGTRDPILSGGFNNTLRIKDFTLSALFSFGLKGVVRLPEYAYWNTLPSNTNVNANIMNRWRKPGDELTTNIPRLTGGATGFSTGSGTFYTARLFNQSTETVVSGNYLRLRNVMLEYTLPLALANKFSPGGRPLQRLSVKLQAQNLFVLKHKRLKGYDPETINYTSSIYGSIPLKTSYTLGLTINF